MRRLVILAVLASLAALAAGCGEREQTALYQNGKFRGKTDTRAWDNAPPALGTAEWNKGDKASWENELRSRSTVQNEYQRIGH